MRAIVIQERGGPEVLQLVDLEQPRVDDGMVLLRVAGCGVCYRDIVDRQGGYPFMRTPIVTGHEIAGVVEQVGANVTELAVGDRVAVVHKRVCGECDACRSGDDARCTSNEMYGLTVPGGYAERCVVFASSAVRVPDEVALEEACFLHCTAAVSLRALRRFGRVQPGETVLVTGASGGVGVHAIQVARLLGARVIATTGSEHKRAALQALGVDEVVVGSGSELLRGILAKGRVDVALELVGAPTFAASLRALRPGGRLVLVGNVTQERIEVNPGYLIFNELELHGSAGATRADLAEVLAWTAAGKLRPVVQARLPLERAREAQQQLVDRGALGRQILVP